MLQANQDIVRLQQKRSMFLISSAPKHGANHPGHTICNTSPIPWNHCSVTESGPARSGTLHSHDTGEMAASSPRRRTIATPHRMSKRTAEAKRLILSPTFLSRPLSWKARWEAASAPN